MGLNHWRLTLVVVAFARSVSAQPDALIRVGDTISLIVIDQPTLTNKHVVQPNGFITVPLVGEVTAAGVSADALSADLEQRLSRFLTTPQLHVGIERVSQVFVFGEVKQPGPYHLTPNMTLLEVLTRAGFNGASEVVVVRPRRSRGPALQGDPEAETIRANLMDLEKDVQAGDLTRNVVLMNGDTIYVPRENPNEIHVVGEVREPGAYAVPEGTTVLQVLTLAGGATPDAAVGRIRLSRFEAGEQESTRAKLTDDVKPGDTVVVPKRIPFPAIDIGAASDPENRSGEFRFGSALSIRPAAVLRQVGFDSNVFNEAGARSTDFTVVAGPELQTRLEFSRVQVKAVGQIDFVYYRTFTSERSINRGATANVEVLPFRRLRLWFGGTVLNTRDRLNSEVDARVPRVDRTLETGVVFQPWRRLEIELTGRDFYQDFEEGAIYLGVDLGDTLTERIRSTAVSARLVVTPLTSVVISASRGAHRFSRFEAKNADATSVTLGAIFKASALSGEARGGYLAYLGLDPSTPDLRSAIGAVDLDLQLREQTRLGMILERTTGDSFRPRFSYSVVDRVGGLIHQGFFQRFDVVLGGYRELVHYKPFATPTASARSESSSERTRRYESEFGTRVGPTRVGFNVTYLQRISTDQNARNYSALRMTANVSYGVFQARGR